MKTMTHKSIIAMSIILLTILNITSCFFDLDNNKNREILHIDFDNHNTHKITGNNFEIGNDKILSNWNDKQLRPNGVLEDNHGKVFQMVLLDWKDVYAKTSVDLKKDSVLTFEFKSEAQQYKNKPGVLQVEIADERNPKNPEVIPIRHNGRGDGWCKASVPISRGKKTIKWNVPIRSDHVGENVIYLDNITIVPNVIDDVIIYPKGKQETYVGGNPIRFAAYPVRLDKSIVLGEHVSYSVNNGGYIDSNGVFSPTKEGNFTITASVGNKTAYKTDVYVHSANYLEELVEIGNYKFTGEVKLKPQIINERTVSNLDTPKVKYDYTVTPIDVNFNADGFFILKGNTQVPLYIEVAKNSNTNLKTYFVIRKIGDFYKRIWLRFGNGDYTVRIIENSNMRFSDGMHSGPSEITYEGELLDANIPITPTCTTLNVTNTNPITENDAKYLLPSEAVQSDSFIISNTANSILEDLGSRRTDGNILRAIHDYVIHYLYQDITSLKYPEHIKRQDAVHVLFYGMATHDGYSNLFAALARNCGIKTQIVQGEVQKQHLNGSYYNNLEHTWNNVYYNGNYYLVDTALDDPFPKNPSINYNERGLMTENYTYFMVPLSDKDHKNGGNDTFRSIN